MLLVPRIVDAYPTHDCQSSVLSDVHTPDRTWLSCSVSTSSHGVRINGFCPNPFITQTGEVDHWRSFLFAYRVCKQVFASAGEVTVNNAGKIFKSFFMGAVGFVRAPLKLHVEFERRGQSHSHAIPRAYLLPSFQSARLENIFAQFSSRASSTCR